MRRLLLPLLLLVSFGIPLAEAQANPRATFPGRRVGGGTRGECNARLIVHLVPESSVFAPGAGGLLGLLEGPSAATHPLQLSFTPQAPGAAASQRLLPAGAPALVLLARPPLQGPTVWASSYRCPEGGPDPADALQVVSSSSPPALSLLVVDVTPADASLSARLQQFRKRCGGSVGRSELAAAFGLVDLLDASWPDQLPVRCPS